MNMNPNGLCPTAQLEQMARAAYEAAIPAVSWLGLEPRKPWDSLASGDQEKWRSVANAAYHASRPAVRMVGTTGPELRL